MEVCVCEIERESLWLIYLPSSEWSSALALLPLTEHCIKD